MQNNVFGLHCDILKFNVESEASFGSQLQSNSIKKV